MPTLRKPQVPTPVNTGKIANWAGIAQAFTGNDTYLRSLVLYLQQYLYSIYQFVVPTQFAPTNIDFSLSPYAIQSTDTFIAASAGAGADTVVNLPAAVGSGRIVIVKKVDANPHNIAVTPVVVTDVIDGATGPDAITMQWAAVSYIDYLQGAWGKF